VDIVISDIRMPGLNGLELSKYIRNHHHPHAKVILLTGYADFSYVQTVIRFGVIDFIEKTNPIDNVIQAVHCSSTRRITILSK
jgi:two-component system response regulator YesN